MPASTLMVWILTCLIWSPVWLFVKIGVRDVPPVTFALFRLLTALAVLGPVTFAAGMPRPRAWRDWLLIATTGFLLLGLNYALLFWGIQFISSGLSAVLQASTPVFGFVFAHALLHDEKMTRLKAVALLLGVGGVAVIFSHQLAIAGPWALWGSVAVVAGAACVAVAYVVMRRHGTHLHPSVVTAGQMLSAIGPLAVLAVLVEGNPLRVRWTTASVLAGLYLALLGAIGGTLNYWLLNRIGATRLLVMGLVEPFIAVVLGVIFLDEKLTGRTLAGGVCIIVSVALVLDLFQRAPAGRARV